MIKKIAKQVLEIEAQSILDLTSHVNESFEQLVHIICNSPGRVIISGIGKSGLIGKKIVATLISTGTNSIFLHPVEALHGDLGLVSKNDVFIAISNSGETAELNQLLPMIRQIGCKIAGFTGSHESSMALECDMLIHTGVEKEACPFNMAPTSSTTAQLAMGDALAVALINQKKFKRSDFIKSHPGGKLGQRLSCKVEEIMLTIEDAPWISANASIHEAIRVIDQARLGAVIVIDEDKHLLGIITDGDIRHQVATNLNKINNLTVDELMTPRPHHLTKKSFLYDALNLMEQHQITVLPIVDSNMELEGILHLHDILGKGSFQFNGGN